jgi:hypothetical protein
MMLRAPETEALYEGYAQKGFGVSILDGSPFPLGSTATSEPIEIPRSLWGRWRSPDGHRNVITSLWIKKHSNPKQINISDNQQPSGDKREGLWAVALSLMGAGFALLRRTRPFFK